MFADVQFAIRYFKLKITSERMFEGTEKHSPAKYAANPLKDIQHWLAIAKPFMKVDHVNSPADFVVYGRKFRAQNVLL